MSDNNNRTDAAAVAEELARSLWLEETGDSPKASDADFLYLITVCQRALTGGDHPENIRTLARSIFE